jgi:PAS domain S-box-containing protein
MNLKSVVHVTCAGDRHTWIYSLCAAILLMLVLSLGVVKGQSPPVRVGVYQNEPKIFMDENGRASGIFIELLDEITAQEGWNLVYVPCKWAACLRALEDGQIDLMPDVAYSAEREAKYDFHKTPVIESWSRVYASPSAPITEFSELDGKRIVVLEGSIQQTVFEQLMNAFGYTVTMVPADSFEQAFALVEHGSADGAIANHLFGDYYYQEYGLSKTTIVFNPAALYYATAEGRHPDLLEVIDRYLSQWYNEPDSLYYTILGHWVKKEAYRVPQYVFWTIGGILGLLVIAAGMSLLLRQQVKVKTRHLEQANAELQESEQRYETLAGISPVGIFRTDPNGNTTYVNPKWSAISGLSFEQALGNGWLDAVHPDDKEELNKDWHESTQHHEPSFSDYRFVRPDGTIAWVMGQAVPEVNSEDEVIGYVGTIVDITRRKQTEDEIQRRNTELAGLNTLGRQVSRSISMSVVISEGVEKMAEVTQSDVAFLFLRDGNKLVLAGIAPPSGTEKYGEIPEHRVGECMCGLAVSLGKPLYSQDIYTDLRCTWEECKKAGYRSMAALPLQSGTDIIGVAGLACEAERNFETQAEFLETIAAQVSGAIQNAQLHKKIQQYAAELELRVQKRTAQLQAANKELESFSYSVSHDLRAPLRAISGFSAIIARRHRANLNEEGRHYVDNIVQASEHMGRLIDDLLTYSRLGRTGVRREPVSLADLMNEISRNMQSRLAEVHGTLHLSEDLPVVSGDHTLLSQVFTNLLENAFTYRKPDISPEVCVTYRSEDDHVIVEVSDNGIGIPPEHQEKIFNMFQRLHSEDEYPGTGIGLATVRKSVELLGGSVWVESNVGEGSTFFIRLSKEKANNE